MIFTDDDLERLKFTNSMPGIGDNMILALIARLEAAEVWRSDGN
jgi:hypothetical protein